MGVKAITIILLSVCAIAHTAPALHSQVISAVKHPDNDKAVLAILEDGQLGEVFLDNSTFNLVINATPGHRDGPLDTSQFHMATAIVWLSEDRYAISDTLNHCIREVKWLDKTVQELTGRQCSDSVHGLHLPRHLARDVRRSDIIYASSSTDGCVSSSVSKIDLTTGDQKEIDITNNFCVIGMAMSQLRAVLYIFSGYLRDYPDSANEQRRYFFWLSVSSVEMGSFGTLESLVEPDGTHSVSEVSESPDTKICTPLGINVRQCGITQVGNHLLAVLGTGSPIVDFDFNRDVVDITCISLQSVPMQDQNYNLSQSIGPTIYVDDTLDPSYLYTWYENRFHTFEALDRCKLKSQSRPHYLTNSWVKAQGYKCHNVESQIGSQDIVEIIHNASDSCATKSCFSTCKERCFAEASCVAFECNSENLVFKIFSCAVVSTVPSPVHSCFRLADVVCAPPLL